MSGIGLTLSPYLASRMKPPAATRPDARSWGPGLLRGIPWLQKDIEVILWAAFHGLKLEIGK